MTVEDSPLRHSIGISGVMRWIIAVAAVVAIGAAVADKRYALAIVTFAFLLVAGILGYRAWRAHQAADTKGAPHPPL